MVIPVKIECECGQHYAFDHDADNGQLAYAAIACPACGVDGTPSANDIIAQSTRIIPAAQPPAPRVRIHIASPAAAVTAPAMTLAASAPAVSHRPMAHTVGGLNPEQAKIEARAKIFWGDDAQEAIKHMMFNGISHAEAKELVDTMVKERNLSLRAIGIKKIAFGVILMCVPAIAWSIFSHIGIIPIKMFAIAIAVGLWGSWMVLKGIIMLVCPKLESGDVADQDQMI